MTLNSPSTQLRHLKQEAVLLQRNRATLYTCYGCEPPYRLYNWLSLIQFLSRSGLDLTACPYSVRLSVCLSHAGIESKLITVGMQISSTLQVKDTNMPNRFLPVTLPHIIRSGLQLSAIPETPRAHSVRRATTHTMCALKHVSHITALCSSVCMSLRLSVCLSACGQNAKKRYFLKILISFSNMPTIRY